MATCKILNDLIKQKKLPALFVGTGITKRYLENYPSWEELLKSLAQIIGISEHAFAAKKARISNANPELSIGTIYQKLASYLQEEFLRKIELGEIDPSTLFTQIECRQCIKGVDYFKMLVAKQLKEYTVKEAMQDELNLFKKIGNKISMVFTTNYDLFLQQEIFPNFEVFTNQNQYYFRTATYGEIYKIHGSVNYPNSIILCENDYAQFENNLKLTSAKLINSLLDFPMIFIGYSLDDENIKKILSDFVSCFSDEILQKVKRSMILISHEKGETELIEGEKQFTSNGKTITLTTIKTDNFEAIYQYIDLLQPTATSYELKRYKDMIAKSITNAAKGHKTIYAKPLEDTADEDIAVYITTHTEIDEFRKSTILYGKDEIVKMALYQEVFAYENFAKDWYESKSIKSNEFVPTFHIRHFLSEPLENYGTCFQRNYHAMKITFDSIAPKKHHVCDNLTALEKKINKIYSNASNTTFTKNMEASQYCWSTMCANKISVEEYRAILQNLCSSHPDIVKASEYKKAVSYLGYRLYETT